MYFVWLRLLHAAMSYGLLPYATCLWEWWSVSSLYCGRWLNSQMEHCMQFRVLHLSSDLGTDNIDLLLRIPKVASKECIGESFETLGDLQVVPGANFFLFTARLVSRHNHTSPG